MTDIRYGDNPTLISTDYLKRLDLDPPGTWLAQPKLDGWRRMAWLSDGKWTWRAKPGGAGSLKPMPADLQAEFEALPWPDGGYDCEWVGPRHAGEAHSLHVFDLIDMNLDAFARDSALMSILDGMLWRGQNRVHFVKTYYNPGLFDRYLEQTTVPASEGLVIRRADSKLIGGRTKCETNPHWFKVKFKNVKE